MSIAGSSIGKNIPCIIRAWTQVVLSSEFVLETLDLLGKTMRNWYTRYAYVAITSEYERPHFLSTLKPYLEIEPS